MPSPLHDKPPSAVRRIKFLRACLHAPKSAVTPRALGQRACSQTQGGAAAVEFALILPILLILLLGTIEGSLAMYDKAVITNASREGARAAIVARNVPLDDAQLIQKISGVVYQYTGNSLVSFGSNSTSSGTTPAMCVTKVAQPTVCFQNLKFNDDRALKVTVMYTFQGIALGSFFQSLGKPLVLQATTVMVYE